MIDVRFLDLPKQIIAFKLMHKKKTTFVVNSRLQLGIHNAKNIKSLLDELSGIDTLHLRGFSIAILFNSDIKGGDDIDC